MRIRIAASILALIFSTLCTTAITAPAENGATFYVAPHGNDAWTGALREPNAAKTDGPFASLHAARNAVRQIKQRGPLVKPITVTIRGGLYRLSEPFTLNAQDSGTTQCPIAYIAESGETPTFSGGRAITNWQRGANGVWTASIPDAKSGAWYFRTLLVNGERRQRARTPNTGYLHAAGKERNTKERSTVEKADRTVFPFAPGDIKRWDTIDDVEVIVFHAWATSRHRIASVNLTSNTVEFKNPANWPFLNWQKDQRYYIENLPEALDAPGEWYLDRRSGMLSYLPLPGEDPTQLEIVAPALTELVVMKANADKGETLEHVTLSGLRFIDSDWTFGPEGHPDKQAGVHAGAAIVGEGLRHCVLKNIEVAHVGGYAIWLGHGCKDNRIEQCHVHDLGSGGIMLGETDLPNDPNAQAERNTVYNCFIRDGSKVFHAGLGVWIGKSSYNEVRNNDICDFLYTGISVGWSWGYQPSSAHHNLIENNHIHHLGYGILSDMGGIYTLGVAPGTVLRHNIIHHVEAFDYGGWGIYPDEGSTELLIENNITYRTEHAGFHQHYGRDNRVRNNIFTFGRVGQLQRTRNEEHRSFFFDHNIVYYDEGNLMYSNWQGDRSKFEFDYNVYWNITDEPVTFAGASFDAWKAKGQDQHSIIADPLFVDAANYDFRLKPESPAFALGFKAIPTDGAGLVGDRAWVDLPKSIKRDWPEPPKPKTSLVDDFDKTEIGAHSGEGTTSGETNGATIRVAQAPNRNGRCLQFTDAPGLKDVWQPHFYYSPNFRTGVARFTCDIRFEEGATFYCEWRDGSQPYKVGPSITLSSNGTLRTPERELTALPKDKWIRVEIACGLGKNSNGKYNLKLTPEGAASQEFNDLTCNPQFRALDWLGFSDLANDRRVFYVDNVAINAEARP